MTIEGGWATPDGAWRVEIVRHGRTRWYQIVRGGDRIDWLGIAAVERILGEAGIDVADLVEVTGDSPPWRARGSLDAWISEQASEIGRGNRAPLRMSRAWTVFSLRLARAWT
jgi:hypothetical protein